MDELSYTVKSVCHLTGLNEHTLRAWERRHGAVSPQRLPNGRRVYTAADIERLRWIVLLGGKGHAIGRIAGLPNSELTMLVARAQELDERRNDAQQSQEALRRRQAIREAVEAVGIALESYQLASIHQELSRARARFGAKAFVLELISPLMGRVGRLILEGRFSIGQEHALSALVKAHLLGMLFDLRRARSVDAPTSPAGDAAGRLGAQVFVIATMEGDLHELGILISAVLCAEAGVTAHYIGANMPPEALGEAARALQASCVLIGASALPPGSLPRSPGSFMTILSGALPATTALWLGGAFDGASPDLAGLSLPQTIRVFKTLAEFDAALV